ncbi:hypothetical protein GCM10008905_17490 [Clostridium malenominatum]|uniref:Uncharacterized protein n=1 Tax=Clostridium malenominatum TaxID=1539 RepID=A0ABN1IYV1_9CLOT
MVMIGAKINYQISPYEIEKRARSMGMEYPEDMKVLIEEEISK